MESNYQPYDFEKSLSRLDEILNANSKSYEEKDCIPKRSSLTYTNGFYVDCTAVFVDICDSSKLPGIHTRPVLAKIYRSFISEVIAIFNGNENCREVNVQGDCVWAVFDTVNKKNLRDVLFNCAQVNSLINILNFKLQKKGYETFRVGIGVDYGRALMIKAGYNGSTINEVVWMGDVVNQASNLCSYGNQSSNDNIIMISSIVYQNLENTKEGMLRDWFTWNPSRSCYHGDIISIYMDNWLQSQR